MNSSRTNYPKILHCVLLFLGFTLITIFKTTAQSDAEKDLLASQTIIADSTTPTSQTFSPEEQEDLKQKALRVARELGNDIHNIADKGLSIQERNDNITSALSLFISEKSLVEVSNYKTQSVKRYKIRDYLTLIKTLQFRSIEIVWFDVVFASSFKLRPDGRYEGIATISQKFIGTKGDGLRYVDITKKSIRIIVSKIEKEGGKNYWDVKLGDIRVEQTKPGE